MKAIFAVSFFGIMMYASAQVPVKCQEQPPMAKFRSSDFFTGARFVTHAKNGPDSAVCRVYQTSENKNNIIFNGDGYYGEKDAERYYQVRCTGKKNSGKNGKYSLSCTKQKPNVPGTPNEKQITFNLDLTILDTDYAQYAIVYRCATYSTLGVTKDNLLVLHRAKDAIKANIASIFRGVTRRSISGFLSRQNAKCKSSNNNSDFDSAIEQLSF
uniref:Pc103, similar to salivary lipocalin n=1 Tax=Panstrongylus chinai TaxID=156444 RepID=A0A286P0W0_9HEMI|nr:Pc103, similar to salivary lipocalin [Panstrongylus chinai]